jgi:anti-sigma B factor antagonist
MMLTSMVGPKAEQTIIVVEGQDDRRGAASLELSYRILPTGEAVAAIGGELDIATADAAVSYLTRVIDRHHGPVIADLAALRFCDARGLSALLRIAHYAEQGDHRFRLASPSPALVKLLRITALDRKLLGATAEVLEQSPTDPFPAPIMIRGGAGRSRRRPRRRGTRPRPGSRS